MQEKDKKICKVCNELKIRIKSGKYPNGKNSKFLCENGREWNGRTCPDCHSNKIKKVMQNVREKAKIGA